MANLRRALSRRHAAELTIEPLIDTIGEFGTVVGEAVGKDYNLSNSRVERFLRKYISDRVDMINGTTRRQLNEAMATDDPRTAVRAVFRHAREARARMIAETEVVRTSNFAVVDAGKWVAALDKKRWVSQKDAAVRHEHQGLHGKVVGWNEKFISPGGYTGPGPGSMTGGPGMNVGCRCVAIPARTTANVDFEDDPVVLFDNLREPLIKQMTEAWRGVFLDQERAVLAELG